MIIDFHTHTFPDRLAGRAVSQLAHNARIRNFLDGTTDDLRRSMANAGIDYSVLLPVVTKPEQQAAVNQIAVELDRRFQETGLISFGGIHPDNEDYRRILRDLARNGIRGIKLHPVFQRTCLDDIRYLRIISQACEQDLIVLVHAGYDISNPDLEYSSVPRILSMLDAVKPPRLVLAHMGGWNCWTETEEQLVGKEIWLDTSFSLLPLHHILDTAQTEETDHRYQLSPEQFLRMVRKHGTDRILFGSDSPWGSQAETLDALRGSGLTDGELRAVLGGNAARLLRLQ